MQNPPAGDDSVGRMQFLLSLRQRGVEEPAASLTAEAGIAVFRIAFERWVTAPDDREFGELIGESLQALRAVTASA